MVLNQVSTTQTQIPGTVYVVIAGSSTVIAVCLDINTANVVAGFNAAWRVITGNIADA
jgi:hypothetical protein